MARGIRSSSEARYTWLRRERLKRHVIPPSRTFRKLTKHRVMRPDCTVASVMSVLSWLQGFTWPREQVVRRLRYTHNRRASAAQVFLLLGKYVQHQPTVQLRLNMRTPTSQAIRTLRETFGDTTRSHVAVLLIDAARLQPGTEQRPFNPHIIVVRDVDDRGVLTNDDVFARHISWATLAWCWGGHAKCTGLFLSKSVDS